MNQELFIDSVSIKTTIISPFKAGIHFCPDFALICILDESTLLKFKANQQMFAESPWVFYKNINKNINSRKVWNNICKIFLYMKVCFCAPRHSRMTF